MLDNRRILALSPRRIDLSSGAEVSLLEMLAWLRQRGWDPTVVCGSQHPTGVSELEIRGMRVYFGHQRPDMARWLRTFDPAVVFGQLSWMVRPLETARAQGRVTVGFQRLDSDLTALHSAGDVLSLFVANSEHALRGVPAGLRSVAVHPPLGDPARWRANGWQPAEQAGRKPTFMLFNPCLVKGADVLRWMAEAFSGRARFVAVAGAYGRQERIPGVTVVPATTEVGALLRDVDVLLAPSIQESYGRVAREALANGIPVLASDLPGLREATGGPSAAVSLLSRTDRAAWSAEAERLLRPEERERARCAALAAAAGWPRAESAEMEALEALLLESTKTRVVTCIPIVRHAVPRRAATPQPPVIVRDPVVLPLVGQLRLLSVLMAVGPVHRWLGEAVRSVLEQELPESWALELLIGVDGVPESLEAARSLPPDPRVGVVALPEPVGCYVVFNTLLGHARGSLITCMGADDEMAPGRLSSLIAALQADPGAAMANGLIQQVDEVGHALRKIDRPADGVWLWRRRALDLLGGWQAWPCGADTELFQRSRKLGLREVIVPEHSYLHRQHGQQLTRAACTGPGTPLRKAAWDLILAEKVLADLGGRPPRIVPETSPHALEGRLFDAPVWAGLASIPGRRESLARAVASLLPQVDRLGVYLNCYDDVPDCLDDPRIEVVRSQDHGDRGDAGKMWWAGRAPGYYLSCDDDLLYPPGYVERLVGAVKARGHGAAVSLHGAILHPGAQRYHRERTVLHCLKAVGADTPVHVLGSGAACWHAPSFRVRPGDFEVPNMADLWLAKVGQERRMPFVCLAHPAGWLQVIAHGDRTIWQACAERSGCRMDTVEQQDRVVRELAPWALHEVRAWTAATTRKPSGMPATPEAAPAAPAAPDPKPRGRSQKS